jgi:hypothetical protein
VTYTQVWEWTFDVPRERLWPFVADTDRINRLAGLPAATYAYEPQPDGGSALRGRLQIGPLVLRFDESPFLWRAPEFHAVERV